MFILPDGEENLFFVAKGIGQGDGTLNVVLDKETLIQLTNKIFVAMIFA